MDSLSIKEHGGEGVVLVFGALVSETIGKGVGETRLYKCRRFTKSCIFHIIALVLEEYRRKEDNCASNSNV